MTREIKFRGKRIDKDVFVFGDILTGMGYKKGKFYILPHLTYYPGDCNSLDGYEVIPETVGQFTGLLDKNGKEIYEGDVIRTKRYGVVHGQSNTQGADLFRVVYKNAQFYIDNKLRHFYLQDSKCNEVIGNIHDNPELLKAETL